MLFEDLDNQLCVQPCSKISDLDRSTLIWTAERSHRAADLSPTSVGLDEPIASLDTFTTRRSLDILRSDPLPTLIASHDPLFTAALATRRVMLQGG